MTDATMQLLAEFRSEVPVPDSEATNRAYRRIVGSARVAGPKPTFRRLIARRRLTAALVLGALVFTAAGVAAVTAPWWQSGGPPVDPQQVVAVARDNLPAHVDVARARTVVTAGNAALVAVPLDATGYCLIPAIDGQATLGAQCEYQVTDPQSGDDDRTISVTRHASGDTRAAWIVYGRITDPRATQIDLGPFSLDLAAGGFFLGQVPQAQWAQLSGSATSGAILDGSGAVLHRGCIDWASEPVGGATAGDGEYPLPLWNASTGGTCARQRPPAQPVIDLSRATKLFDVRLIHDDGPWKAGETITMERAPRSDGTTCLVASGPGNHGEGRGGEFTNACAATAGATSTQPISVTFGATLTHLDGKAAYVWEISGTTEPQIAKLELRSDTATTSVPSGGGFFFAQLPTTSPGPQKGTVTMPPGKWLLVGLDITGRQVAQVDLPAARRQATPH